MQILNRFDSSYAQYANVFPNVKKSILVDLSILTDDDIDNSVAWLIEPNEVLSSYIRQSVFELMRQKLLSGAHRFSKLYTSFRCFADLPNVFILDKPPLSSWVSDEDAAKDHKKERDLVFITSNKQITQMQVYRTHIAQIMMQNGFEVYGRGYKPVEFKSEVLSPSRFCVSVENSIHKGFHTEKVLDCFRTKTIPLYVGDPLIEEVYDKKGMFIFKSVEELINSDIMVSLLQRKPMHDLYDTMFQYVEENYARYQNSAPLYDPVTSIKTILENTSE